MGARLYNPNTGRFVSRDPVAGGNDNTYTYPVDPINKLDLDEEKSTWKKFKKAIKKGWKNTRKFARRHGQSAWRRGGKALGAVALSYCFIKRQVKVRVHSRTPWGDIWQTYWKPTVIAVKCWNPFS